MLLQEFTASSFSTRPILRESQHSLFAGFFPLSVFFSGAGVSPSFFLGAFFVVVVFFFAGSFLVGAAADLGSDFFDSLDFWRFVSAVEKGIFKLSARFFVFWGESADELRKKWELLRVISF